MTGESTDKPLEEPEGPADKPPAEPEGLHPEDEKAVADKLAYEDRLEAIMADVRASGGVSPDLPQSARTDPPVLSHMDEEDRGGADYGLTDEAFERNRRRRTLKAALAAVGVVILLGAAGLLLLGGGDDDSTDAASGGSQQSGGQPAAVVPPTNTPTPAPTQTPIPQPPTVAVTDQQLQDANISATDLPDYYDTCAHEFALQNDTDVQQSVSSSPDMMAAMADAGFAGARSVSRAVTPCPRLPYNIASVMGLAKSLADAEALFDAAVLNYGQRLFNNVATFGLAGDWDESYCQSGAFPPQNIIAVACWVREAQFVAGFFYLLPPGSPEAVIEQGRQDAAAFWQRVASVIAPQ